jgi:predicted nuclease with TOPRIM domain
MSVERIEEINARKNEIENEIETLKETISSKEWDRDNIELDPDDYEEQFCSMMDDEGDVIIWGYTYSPSYALKELDPTAFRCSLNDYVSCLDIEDTKEYKELQEEIESLEENVSNLEDELSDLEDELSDLEDELSDLEDEE